jgi:hypothetical protein
MMEDVTFNLNMAEKAKVEMVTHMEATELLITEISNKNPAYAAQVMTRFPDFPVFIEPAQFNLMAPIQVLMSQGQAQQPGVMAPEQQTAGESAMMNPAMGAELTTTATNPMDINAAPVEQGQAAYTEGL